MRESIQSKCSPENAVHRDPSEARVERKQGSTYLNTAPAVTVRRTERVQQPALTRLSSGAKLSLSAGYQPCEAAGFDFPAQPERLQREGRGSGQERLTVEGAVARSGFGGRVSLLLLRWLWRSPIETHRALREGGERGWSD